MTEKPEYSVDDRIFINLRMFKDRYQILQTFTSILHANGALSQRGVNGLIVAAVEILLMLIKSNGQLPDLTTNEKIFAIIRKYENQYGIPARKRKPGRKIGSKVIKKDPNAFNHLTVPEAEE